MEIFKRGGETLEPALFQEGAEAQFDPGPVAQGRMPVAAEAERLGDVVALLIFAAKGIDRRIAGAIDMLDEIAEAFASADGAAYRDEGATKESTRPDRPLA